jgi:hypothetical protein
MVESSGSSRSSGVLSEHGYPITTYYAAKTRRVCDLVDPRCGAAGPREVWRQLHGRRCGSPLHPNG